VFLPPDLTDLIMVDFKVLTGEGIKVFFALFNPNSPYLFFPQDLFLNLVLIKDFKLRIK
jgi:hypothetical protein